MALVTLDIAADAAPPAPREQQVILAADTLIDGFRQRPGTPIGFVPSDAELVLQVLRSIRNGGYAQGEMFLEWGSGVGTVTCLASLLGFEAFGIEIHRELHEAAEGLAMVQNCEATFALGSFVPESGQEITDAVGDSCWLESGVSAYGDLGIDPEDADLIFAYPWPEEEHVTFALFDRFASPGSLLITYHGYEGVRVQRKRF